MTKCNFAGDEKAGASWTDKIMANKADVSSSQEPGGGGGGEGAEEDEWVRAKSIPNKTWLGNLQSCIFLLISESFPRNCPNMSCRLHISKKL